SAARTPYAFPVAPATSAQAEPLGSQRCHWYVNEVTPPVHVPFEVLSSSPGCGVPVMAGRAVLFGAWLSETTVVGFENAAVRPSAFNAATRTRIVLSMSVLVSVYVLPPAPTMFAQALPSAAHR